MSGDHVFHAEDVDVDVGQVREKHAAGEIQLIDVREPHEWEAGRIEGARHVELERVASEAESIDRERPVVFYCRLGARSGMAANAFRRAGYDAFCGAPARDDAPNAAELTPAELGARMGEVELIDVREPHEWEIGRIEGARLVPLGTLPAAMASLDGRREIVVYCRSGVRSAQAARQLAAAGFRVSSLAGGILRWSDDVDPAVPKY